MIFVKHIAVKNACLMMLAAFAAGFAVAEAREPQQRFTPLFSTSTTVMDEAIVYPAGQAKLTGAILALQPGEETGWHIHGAPLTGIVLEGELTVDYGPRGTRSFKTGDAIAEAMQVAHNGRNQGTAPVRLFVVFIGADGVTNTTPVKP